ncbi:MAG: hypothetical protein U1A25_02720 [Candidatus Sungbacteria bacterium]|nr:hypothetical protein [Candidatus Sungbacteria bacterium]
MKNFLENTKLIINLSILIIALSASYYFLLVKPDIEKGRLGIQQKEFEIKQEQASKIKEESDRVIAAKIQNEALFNSCIENAHEQYDGSWSNGCKGLGRPNDCTNLPHYLSDSLEASLQTTKLNCAKLYR